MFMTRGPNEKKFEADVSRELWDRYEEWAASHGRISNRQLAEAMFRLFLNVPEWLRVMALYGFDGESLMREAFADTRLTVTTGPRMTDRELAEATVDAAQASEAGPPGRRDATATKAG
jgi:hypothetical protein